MTSSKTISNLISAEEWSHYLFISEFDATAYTENQAADIHKCYGNDTQLDEIQDCITHEENMLKSIKCGKCWAK